MDCLPLRFFCLFSNGMAGWGFICGGKINWEVALCREREKNSYRVGGMQGRVLALALTSGCQEISTKLFREDLE